MEDKVKTLLKDIEKCTLPFGKFKGETVGDVLIEDRSYIEWMARTEGPSAIALRFYLDNEDMI